MTVHTYPALRARQAADHEVFVFAASPEEVLEFAKENLTGYKRPRYVEFMEELPKSNVGKILRKDLRKSA